MARANLSEAHLGDADLREANLSQADLRGANLSGAEYNEYTTCPDDFNPEKAGAILVE